MSTPADILETARAELSAGRRVALCAVVATRGSTPQPAGALLCVDVAGRITGTLGGGCVEGEVRQRAHALLTGPGGPSTAAVGELLTFDLDHDDDDGMICGGSMDVAVEVLDSPADAEPLREALAALRAGRDAAVCLRARHHGSDQRYRVHLETPPRLVIAGAGHIARLLARFAVPLGFRVTVIDHRAAYANARRFPPPVEPIVGDIAETLRRQPIDASTYVVIVTRGHAHDEKALSAVIDSPAAYLGMIGSRRKIDSVFERLRAQGKTPEQLRRVHAPIGLDIGAVTTEEIALSITAELVSVRRAAHRPVVEGPMPVGSGTSLSESCQSG